MYEAIALTAYYTQQYLMPFLFTVLMVTIIKVFVSNIKGEKK